MSTLAISELSSFQQPSTSSAGALPRILDYMIQIGGALTIRGTAAGRNTTSSLAHISATQTNSGLIVHTISQTAAISEIRRRSALTWDQIACLFDVSRRSVHFWASGKAMNAANEEKLNQLLRTIRYIDRGASRSTREALTSAMKDGTIPFELLVQGEFDEVMGRLGQGRGRDEIAMIPVPTKPIHVVTPPSPDQLVGALHDTVHKNLGRGRAAYSVKAKKKS
jgi:DNA-binding transcriptional regulator YiaG